MSSTASAVPSGHPFNPRLLKINHLQPLGSAALGKIIGVASRNQGTEQRLCKLRHNMRPF
jgi:hypothetical protein